jgi:hypothetical protein
VSFKARKEGEQPSQELSVIGRIEAKGIFSIDKPVREIVVGEGVKEALVNLGIELGEWAWPARGPTAELEALVNLHKGIVPLDAPLELAEAERLVLKMYPRTATGWHHGIESALEEGRFEKILRSVKPDSSPGVPWSGLGNRNDELLSDPAIGALIGGVVKFRVRQLSEADPDDLERCVKEDPMYAVRRDLADPVRVFVKNEPHKLKKILSRRWRIINSLSLVDQIVEKVIFWNQDDFEKTVWADIPSKPGMGLTDDDEKRLVSYAGAHDLCVGSDASNFDISVPDFLVRADERVRIALAKDATAPWVRAMRNFNTLMIRRVICTSSGLCLVRNFAGGVISGRSVTASSNSRMRGLIHATIAVRHGVDPGFMSMGDDCVEREIPCDLQAEVKESFGILLTDIQKFSKGFSFCSHRMGLGLGPIPEQPAKMIAKFLAGPKMDAYMSMELNLRHLPRKKSVLSLLGPLVQEWAPPLLN